MGRKQGLVTDDSRPEWSSEQVRALCGVGSVFSRRCLCSSERFRSPYFYLSRRCLCLPCASARPFFSFLRVLPLANRDFVECFRSPPGPFAGFPPAYFLCIFPVAILCAQVAASFLQDLACTYGASVSACLLSCKCFRLLTYLQVFPLAYVPASVSACLLLASVSACLLLCKCFRLLTFLQAFPLAYFLQVRLPTFLQVFPLAYFACVSTCLFHTSRISL